MKTLTAFTKKEWIEQFRSGRFIVTGILFILLGIMNPALAKLTPWALEILAADMESGITITAVTVTAMTSWTQFFKNIPMGLLAFILLESNIFTKEYQSGTLVLTLTKGFERYKVVLSKTTVLTVLWSVCYWVCFAITYGYNEFFWDNAIVHNLVFAVICWWLFGIWIIMLTVLFSTIAAANTGVLAGTGAVFLVVYLVSLLPKTKKYLPMMLTDSISLLTDAEKASSYGCAVAITAALCVIFGIAGILTLNRKQL